MIVDQVRIRQLRTFVAIAEHGSLVKAAEAMSLTQPAVTKSLAQLEEVVGRRLVERSRRGVRLTAAGQMLLRYAGVSLRSLGEGLDRVSRADGLEVPAISVGSLPGVGATVLPRAIERFQDAVSVTRIRVRSGSNAYLLNLLRQGDLDCVIGRLGDSSEMSGLSFESLGAEHMAFAVRPTHALTEKPRVSATNLLSYRLLLPDRGTQIRELADRFFVAAGFPLQDATIETIDPMFARVYVMQTDTIWFAPMGVLENDLRDGVLARLPIDTSATKGEIGITLRSDRVASELTDRFLACLREAATEHGAFLKAT